jgi:hypothetical protein
MEEYAFREAAHHGHYLGDRRCRRLERSFTKGKGQKGLQRLMNIQLQEDVSDNVGALAI